MTSLSISNLAWPEFEEIWCLDILQEFKFTGIEIAPTKIFGNWSEIDKSSCTAFLNKIISKNLLVSSIQSITYGEKLKLDSVGHDRLELLDHFERVCSIMDWLGAEIAVFGSPNLRVNNLKINDMVSNFREIGGIFKKLDKKIVIEAVPNYYGSNSLKNINQVAEFIQLVNVSSVCSHFDSACQFLSGDLYTLKLEEIEKHIAHSSHFHFSRKDLKSFSVVDDFNENLLPLVRKYYKGNWLVFEVGNGDFTRFGFREQLGVINKFVNSDF